MSGLTAFMAGNAAKAQNIKYVASKRFVDEENKPIEWEICSVTGDEDEKIRNKFTKRAQINGKKNQYTQDFDVTGYLGELAARCTVFPNLNDKDLQDSYGVMGADVLLKTMLNPGEYQDFLRKVQEACGFDTAMEDLVDEAKN